jgi:hypothetical protein
MKMKVFETFNDEVLWPDKCLKNKYSVQILPSSTNSSSMSATLLAISPENNTLLYMQNKFFCIFLAWLECVGNTFA